jgi:hypothetical protein
MRPGTTTSQAADRLIDGFDVSTAEGSTEVHTALQHADTVGRPKPVPAFAQEVAHQTKVICEVLGRV